MSWDEIVLGSLCSKIGSGATPKGGATVYIDKGTSFIRSQNVYNLHFSYEGLAHITENAAQKLKGVSVQEHDVLINITGDSVARTCVVPSEVLPARVSQHVAIIRTERNVLDPYYLNYYLASPYMQAFMLGLAVGKGASRNAMTKDMISGFKIPCPPIDIQKRISDVLTDFDNLIENNQKQIKLLEEAAQRLYKEWFVDLRFPGHENVKIIDGVPEGWEEVSLKKLAFLKAGGDKPKLFFHKKNERCTVPVYSNGINNDGLYGYTDKPSIMNHSVTITARGNVGFVCLHRKPYFPIVRLISVVPININLFYLYFYLKNSILDGNGSAQQQITIPMIEAQNVIIPNEMIINNFSVIATSIFDEIDALRKKIELLMEARDRLLPKLMSGEIEL